MLDFTIPTVAKHGLLLVGIDMINTLSTTQTKSAMTTIKIRVPLEGSIN
jgi:hypothetical protein